MSSAALWSSHLHFDSSKPDTNDEDTRQNLRLLHLRLVDDRKRHPGRYSGLNDPAKKTSVGSTTPTASPRLLRASAPPAKPALELIFPLIVPKFVQQNPPDDPAPKRLLGQYHSLLPAYDSSVDRRAHRPRPDPSPNRHCTASRVTRTAQDWGSTAFALSEDGVGSEPHGRVRPHRARLRPGGYFGGRVCGVEDGMEGFLAELLDGAWADQEDRHLAFRALQLEEHAIGMDGTYNMVVWGWFGD